MTAINFEYQVTLFHSIVIDELYSRFFSFAKAVKIAVPLGNILFRLPGGAEKRQEKTVHSYISGNSPRQNKTDAKDKQNRIDADCSSKQIVEIHKKSDKSSYPSEGSYDKGNPDYYFPISHHMRPEVRVRQYDVL